MFVVCAGTESPLVDVQLVDSSHLTVHQVARKY